MGGWKTEICWWLLSNVTEAYVNVPFANEETLTFTSLTVITRRSGALLATRITN